ncbi:MAG: PaaI family thioesterase [Firmicutes bacterium]|nr:PaaI family thioesterase [Bacillota bacterium]
MSPAPRIGYSKHCFVCGQENERGLRARFEVLDGQARTVVRPPAHVRGFQGMLHGGIIAALCDEVMWYAGFSRDLFTVTADLSVRYKAPVPVEGEVSAEGRVLEVRRKIVRTAAELRGPGGEVLALAEGRFFVVPPATILGDEEIRLYEAGRWTGAGAAPCPGSRALGPEGGAPQFLL